VAVGHQHEYGDRKEIGGGRFVETCAVCGMQIESEEL
jgi:hypothetical protein